MPPRPDAQAYELSVRAHSLCYGLLPLVQAVEGVFEDTSALGISDVTDDITRTFGDAHFSARRTMPEAHVNSHGGPRGPPLLLPFCHD